MTKQMDGQVAIISGATSGMGKGIALLFAQEGAQVVVNGRNPDRGNAVVREIEENGGEAIFVQSDIARAGEVESLVQKTVNAFGKVTTLVPNAGVLGNGSVTELSLETWDKTLGINLNGVFYLCKYGIPELIKNGRGSIVINASIASYKGFPNHPAYCASKGALIPLAKNLALDYAKNKIRVNCICPGPVDTPLLWDSAQAFPNPETVVQEVGENTCIGRLGTSEDVAKLALFLATENAAWITGSAMTIDGGIMAG